jgi:hypothetical protein
VADFCSSPNPTWTQHDQHGPDDPLKTINYHHLDISGHDGMDEQDVGWRNVACVDEVLEVWQMWLWFLFKPQPYTWTQHDQHGPDDPLKTINYHHLDISGHDGMDG